MKARNPKILQPLLLILVIVAVAAAFGSAPLAADGETVVEKRIKLKVVDDETDPPSVDMLELSDLDELEIGQTRQEYTSSGKQVFITRESEDVYEFDIEGRIIRVGEEIEAPEGARIIKKRIEVSGEGGSGENVWVDDKKHVIKIDGAGEGGEKNIFVMKGGSGENTWVDDEGRVIEIGEGGEKKIIVMKGDGELHAEHGMEGHKVIRIDGEGGQRVIKIGDEEPIVIDGEGAQVVMIKDGTGEVMQIDVSELGEGMVFTTEDGKTINLHELIGEGGLEGLDLSELGDDVRVMVKVCDGEGECEETVHGATSVHHIGGEGEHVIEKVVVIEREEDN